MGRSTFNSRVTNPSLSRQYGTCDFSRMANIGDTFHPGMEVPDSEFYECDANEGHKWSVNVRGHRFPPLLDGCKGHGWVLKERTPIAEEVHGAAQAIPGVEISNPQ